MDSLSFDQSLNLCDYPIVYPRDFYKLMGLGQESHCRFLWFRHYKNKELSKWFPFGEIHRKSGKIISSSHTIASCKMAATSYNAKVGEEQTSQNLYYTPNQFFAWRNKAQIARLQANYVDIDVRDKDSNLTPEQEQQILKEVSLALASANIPAPNALVKSGSGGLHLYWIYDEVIGYKRHQILWHDIASLIVKRLKIAINENSLWYVDSGASNDVSRLLRLPGSIHGGSGRSVTAHIKENKRYSFTELYEQITGKPYVPVVYLKRENKLSEDKKTVKTDLKAQESKLDKTNLDRNGSKAKTDNVTSDPKRVQTSKHNIKTWWFNVFTRVLQFAKDDELIRKRNHTAFILTVALRHIHDKETTLEIIKDINNNFIGRDEQKLISHLTSALNKSYRYKKDSLAAFLENLGMDSSFLYTNTKLLLSEEERRERKRDGALITAHKKSQDTLSILNNALIEAKSTGLRATQANIAMISQRSVRTVRRYWKKLNHQLEVISSASI